MSRRKDPFIPEEKGLELSRMVYELKFDNEEYPKEGHYLVSIGKKGIGTVWLIVGVQKVRQKNPSISVKFNLQLLPSPEMRPYTEFEMRIHDLQTVTANVWVRGEKAWPLFWTPRNKKC